MATRERVESMIRRDHLLFLKAGKQPVGGIITAASIAAEVRHEPLIAKRKGSHVLTVLDEKTSAEEELTRMQGKENTGLLTWASCPQNH